MKTKKNADVNAVKAEENANSRDLAPRRTLVREILITQFVYALIVGVAALACLWSGSNWIANDNMTDRAVKWIDDLDYLGAGLYLDGDNERYLRIEGYVSKFQEILYVRYYAPDKQLIHTEARAETTTPPLRPSDLARLLELSGSDDYLIDESSGDGLVRISKAIVTESIRSDGLMTVDNIEDIETDTTVAGFIELGLNYGSYYDDLVRSMVRASGAIALAFLALALVGRELLRRALKPLKDIQKPLAQLADGDTDIQVVPSPYRELAAITNGLSKAAERIRERDARLTRLANYDVLTGLPNRHFFMEQFEEALRQSTESQRPQNSQDSQHPQHVVLFVDLDQFKYINDTHGHSAGDVILKQAAARIRRAVPEHQTVARFGGDEFAVFLSCTDSEDAVRTANRVMHDISEYPLIYGSHSFNLNCCVGISCVEEAGAFTATEILAQADLACQKAKSDGRNRVRVYEHETGSIETIKLDIGWSQKIKEALKRDDLVLHYQPIVELKSGKVSHFEVLVRIKDGDEIHLPGSFLSAATRFGLMRDIDRWVLENAIRNLVWFRRRDPTMRFTINVSGGSFADGDLVAFVTAQLEANALDASAIMLEITEQTAVGSVNDAISQINQLTELGCEFAIDDFGAGYSSLNYLKKLPVQYVKIDGTFVTKLVDSKADQAIVKAVAEIAKVTGKKTIAEFVENVETLALLRKFGIDYGQGYLFGKPEATARLEQQRSA